MTWRKHAWAAILLLIVGIPLVLFALVGLPHLFRGSLVRNVIAREAGGEPPDVTSPHFEPAFTLLTGSPLTAGNAVEVLANGDATFALVALDAGVGATLESLFLDDLGFADEIRLEAFRRRPRTERLLERAASVLASLL